MLPRIAPKQSGGASGGGGGGQRGGEESVYRVSAPASVHPVCRIIEVPIEGAAAAGRLPRVNSDGAPRQGSNSRGSGGGGAAAASRKSPAGPPPASSSRSTSAPHERPPPARDIIAKNKLAAGTPGRPPRPTKEDEGAKYRQKKDLGQVPDYLLRRKVENIEKAEAEARAKEAALIPPGLRLVPEEERMETLRILQANKAELERAIWALPLKIETLGQRKRKEALDERMQEIEQGLQIFSRPKVLVRA